MGTVITQKGKHCLILIEKKKSKAFYGEKWPTTQNARSPDFVKCRTPQTMPIQATPSTFCPQPGDNIRHNKRHHSAPDDEAKADTLPSIQLGNCHGSFLHEPDPDRMTGPRERAARFFILYAALAVDCAIRADSMICEACTSRILPSYYHNIGPKRDP